MEEDVRIQIGLGRVLRGAKFRARSCSRSTAGPATTPRANRPSPPTAKRAQRMGRHGGKGARVYVPDITYGDTPVRRGHWIDRLPAIDQDLAAMEAARFEPGIRRQAGADESGDPGGHGKAQPPVREMRPHSAREFSAGEFRRSQPAAERRGPRRAPLLPACDPCRALAGCRYGARGQGFKAAIPADYTKSPYPLEYYFELRRDPATAWLYPGFAADLGNQPYYALMPKA